MIPKNEACLNISPWYDEYVSESQYDLFSEAKSRFYFNIKKRLDFNNYASLF